MASSKFSYQRLRNFNGLEEEEREQIKAVAICRTRSWWKPKGGSSRRRTRIRIPSLRRFLKRRARLLSAARVSWVKVWKRLKESRAHFGDLFAGNYMLMQVSPSPFGSTDKSFVGCDQSKYPVRKIA